MSLAGVLMNICSYCNENLTSTKAENCKDFQNTVDISEADKCCISDHLADVDRKRVLIRQDEIPSVRALLCDHDHADSSAGHPASPTLTIKQGMPQIPCNLCYIRRGRGVSTLSWCLTKDKNKSIGFKNNIKNKIKKAKYVLISWLSLSSVCTGNM